MVGRWFGPVVSVSAFGLRNLFLVSCVRFRSPLVVRCRIVFSNSKLNMSGLVDEDFRSSCSRVGRAWWEHDLPMLWTWTCFYRCKFAWKGLACRPLYTKTGIKLEREHKWAFRDGVVHVSGGLRSPPLLCAAVWHSGQCRFLVWLPRNIRSSNWLTQLEMTNYMWEPWSLSLCVGTFRSFGRVYCLEFVGRRIAECYRGNARPDAC